MPHTSSQRPALGIMFVLIAGVFWALYIRSSAKAGALVPGASGLAVAIAGWALLNQETGPIRWMAIFLLMTASVGIMLTTTKGGSPQLKDDGKNPVPLPLPE